MKFNTIESVWAYAKKKCPSGVIISTVKKMSGGLKAFDITIPKSKVTKWPVDVKDEDLEYTISSDMSGIFAFLEINNSELELDDSSDFAEFVLNTMGLKESLNESDQTWFKIDNHNYDKYGIQQDAYTTMVRLTGENSFMFANRYNQQNKESISVGTLMQSIEGSKCIKSTFANTTSVMIYTLKDGILVVEPGQSKFDEKVYVSNKVYQSLNVNESLNESLKMSIRPLSPKVMGDFSQKELDYLKTHLGPKIFQVTAWNKNFKPLDAKMKLAHKKESVHLDDFIYTLYEMKSGQKVILMDSGYGDIAYMLGSNVLNESLNENAIIGITDSSNNAWDKEICFAYYGTRADLDKQLAKLKKPYLLEVMPGDEATLHCKNNDVIIFKGYLSALKESLNEATNKKPKQKPKKFADVKVGNIGEDYNGDKYKILFKGKGIKQLRDTEKRYLSIGSFGFGADSVEEDDDIKKMYDNGWVIVKIKDKEYTSFAYDESGFLVYEDINESEHMQATGKLFYTAEEIGVLSDEAIKTALETLSGQMSELSTDPAEESIKAYKEHENTYIDLKSELEKRGLK